MYFEDSIDGVRDFCDAEGQPHEALDQLIAEVDSILNNPILSPYTADVLRKPRNAVLWRPSRPPM